MSKTPVHRSDSIELIDVYIEADLGMFTIRPNRGPHKRTGKFWLHSNIPEII